MQNVLLKFREIIKNTTEHPKIENGLILLIRVVKYFFYFIKTVIAIYLYDHNYVKVHVILHYKGLGPRLEVIKLFSCFFMLNSTEQERISSD